MYASFFGFRENPFNLTPDPRYLFLSQYHKGALEFLCDAIKNRNGLITVTGDIGTGKTTVCRALLYKLDASTKSALIFNSFISDVELLVTISQEFGLESSSKGQPEKDYFAALKRFLLRSFRREGNAVLLIDEAQNLSNSVLEQILRLSELEEAGEKLIQVILVGQSELNNVLQVSPLKPLIKRTKYSYHLKPLKSIDSRGYIEHRLKVAGGPGNVRFKENALRKLYTYAQGNPRRINAVCDRALLIAYVKEKHTITKRIVGTAIQELQLETEPKARAFRGWTWKRFAPSFALLSLLVITLGFAYWTLKEKILWKLFEEEETLISKVVRPLPSRPEPRAVNPEAKAGNVGDLEQVHRAQKAHFQRESLHLISYKPFDQNQRKEELTVLESLGTGKSAQSKKLGFSVQVGAFLEKSNAERLAAYLKRSGYEPYISTFSGYCGKDWYSVRILDCASLKDAQLAVSEYRQKEGKPAIITRLHSLNPVAAQNDNS